MLSLNHSKTESWNAAEVVVAAVFLTRTICRAIVSDQALIRFCNRVTWQNRLAHLYFLNLLKESFGSRGLVCVVRLLPRFSFLQPLTGYVPVLRPLSLTCEVRLSWHRQGVFG